MADLNPHKLGSIEEQAIFLGRELRKRGHELYCSFLSEPVPEIKQLFMDSGAHLLDVRYAPVIGYTKQFKTGDIYRLYQAIKDKHIDLVHVNFNWVTNPELLGLYLSGAKIVFTDHDSGPKLSSKRFRHALLRRINQMISWRITRFFGVSQYVCKRLLRTHLVTGDKVELIYNGVNLDRFKPQSAGYARKKLELPEGKRIICAVAMLIPEKGIQILLQAVARLVYENCKTDVILLVAGEGYFRNELERLAGDLQIMDHVRFLGRRSDIHDLVASSDIIAVPSLWEEAFGLIIAEGMASGRPVVASNIGGIPELIENGVSGITVQPGNVEQLAAALNTLLESSDTCRAMGAAALQKAQKDFDIVRQTSILADVYNRLLYP